MAQANVVVGDNLVPAPEEAKSDSNKEEDVVTKTEAKRLERNAKAKAARDAKKAAATAANAQAPAPVAAPVPVPVAAPVAKAPEPVAAQATENSVEEDAEFKEIFQEPAVVPTKSAELSQSPVDSDSEEDATSVSKFEFQGKTYLKDDEDGLYDVETQEHIGNFDEVNQCIDYYEDEDED